MFSELKVMSSNAGYYIGRSSTEYGDPYSRESDYYPTYGAAEKDLNNKTFVVRDCSENNFAYDTGTLPDIR